MFGIKEYLISSKDVADIKGLIHDPLGVLDGMETQLLRRRRFADAFSGVQSLTNLVALTELASHDHLSALSLPVALVLPKVINLGKNYYDRREAIDISWRLRMATTELVRERSADMMDVEGWDKKRVESFAQSGLASILSHEWKTQPSNLGWEAGILVFGLIATNWWKELGLSSAVFAGSTIIRDQATKGYLKLSDQWHSFNKDLAAFIYKQRGLEKSKPISESKIKSLANGYSKNTFFFTLVDSMVSVGLPSLLTLLDPTRVASYLFLGNTANSISDTWTDMRTDSADRAPDLKEVRQMLEHIKRFGTVIATPTDWERIRSTNQLTRSRSNEGLHSLEDIYDNFDPDEVMCGREGLLIGDFHSTLSRKHGDEKIPIEIRGPIFLEKGKVHRVIGDTGEGKSVFMETLAMLRHFDKGAMFLRLGNWGKDIFQLSFEEMRQTIGYYSSGRYDFLKRPSDDFGVQAILRSNGLDYTTWAVSIKQYEPNEIIERFLRRFPFSADKKFDSPLEQELYWRIFGGRGKVNQDETEKWLEKNTKKSEHSKAREALNQIDEFVIYKASQYLIQSGLFKPEDCERIVATGYDKLSMGERARLRLLQALHERPHVLIIDEVLENVDPQMKRSIAKRLREYAESGRVVIVVTHQENEIWNDLMQESTGETLIVKRQGNLRILSIN